jgi:hypothetical protein
MVYLTAARLKIAVSNFGSASYAEKVWRIYLGIPGTYRPVHLDQMHCSPPNFPEMT